MDPSHPAPHVGMGLTIQVGSDRYAGTISRLTPARIYYREDKAIRLDRNGQSEDQIYTYQPDPKAPERGAYLTTKGRWRELGQGGWITLGKRNAYCDPSF